MLGWAYKWLGWAFTLVVKINFAKLEGGLEPVEAPLVDSPLGVSTLVITRKMIRALQREKISSHSGTSYLFLLWFCMYVSEILLISPPYRRLVTQSYI